MSDSPSRYSPRTTAPFASTGVGTQNATEMSGESKQTEAAHTGGALRSPPLPPFHMLRGASYDRARDTGSPGLPPLLENIGADFVEGRPRLPPVETLPGYHGLRLSSSNPAGPSSRVVISRKRVRDLVNAGPSSGSSPAASPALLEPAEDSSQVETRRKRRRLSNDPLSPAAVTSDDAGVIELVHARPRPVVPSRRERSRRVPTNGILESGEVIEVGCTLPVSSLSQHRGRPRRVVEIDELSEDGYRRTRHVLSPAILGSRQPSRPIFVDSPRPSLSGTRWVATEDLVPQAPPHVPVVEADNTLIINEEQVLGTGIQRLGTTGSQNAILNSAIPPSDFRRRFRYSGRVMRSTSRSSNSPIRSAALRPRVREYVSPRSITVESAPIPNTATRGPPRAVRVSRRPPIGRPRRSFTAFFRSMNARDLANVDDEMMRQRNAAPKAVVAALPETVATEADTEIRCAICMCDIEVKEKLRILPCTHRYHKKCIEDWLSYNACCPMDKQRICPVQPIRPNDLF